MNGFFGEPTDTERPSGVAREFNEGADLREAKERWRATLPDRGRCGVCASGGAWCALSRGHAGSHRALDGEAFDV